MKIGDRVTYYERGDDCWITHDYWNPRWVKFPQLCEGVVTATRKDGTVNVRFDGDTLVTRGLRIDELNPSPEWVAERNDGWRIAVRLHASRYRQRLDVLAAELDAILAQVERV